MALRNPPCIFHRGKEPEGDHDRCEEQARDQPHDIAVPRRLGGSYELMHDQRDRDDRERDDRDGVVGEDRPGGEGEPRHPAERAPPRRRPPTASCESRSRRRVTPSGPYGAGPPDDRVAEDRHLPHARRPGRGAAVREREVAVATRRRPGRSSTSQPNGLDLYGWCSALSSPFAGEVPGHDVEVPQRPEGVTRLSEESRGRLVDICPPRRRVVAVAVAEPGPRTTSWWIRKPVHVTR